PMGALLLHPSRRGPAGVVASWTSSPAGRDGGVGIAGACYFPRASSQAREMPQCPTLESQEGANSEEKRDSSKEDPKETVALAFVRENPGAQNGLQNAQQQGKKKRKKKRMPLKNSRKRRFPCFKKALICPGNLVHLQYDSTILTYQDPTAACAFRFLFNISPCLAPFRLIDEGKLVHFLIHSFP
ncbi:TTLL6 isoform 3, partial [Pongo abelii]